MGKHIDITKDYGKYRTLSILPIENKTEYEKKMQPDPVNGIDVHAVLTILSLEAKNGVEKEMDVMVAGDKKRILVKVPAGMENGKFIRYREKGEPGQWGGKNGDLYVRIVVEPETIKEEPKRTPVNGRDINCTLQITKEEWVTGVQKEKEVVIDGEIRRILVKVPPMIQNRAAIRYRGKGEAGKDGGQNGDLYVRIVMLKETKVSDEKKEEKEENIQNQTESSGPTDENTIHIDITFLEACKGTEKEIIFPEKINCKKCKGTGKLKIRNCSACKGSGVVDAPKKLHIKIPAGIDEGQLLRFKGKEKLSDKFQGLFGSSTESADAEKKLNQDWYVKIHVEKHPKFERKGYDIYSTETLPKYIGAGRMVAVDTLEGKQYCNVTKDTKDGSQICLENKGIPHLNPAYVRGNHYVTWKKK